MHNLISKKIFWIFVAVFVVLLDQLTKQWAIDYFSTSEPFTLLPVLNFSLAHNRGAAWSLLNNAGGWQRWFFIFTACIISLIIVTWLSRLKKNDYFTAISLSLILGGALGNLVDRIYYGYVIDFIQFHVGDWYFPTFNIADSAISIGAVILVVRAFFAKEESETVLSHENKF